MSADKQLPADPEKKGWLYKWTNYLKGYQKRFFVLANGVLSYYRNHAEMIHTCRGSISLHGASIHTEDSCNFVVSNGRTQTFHLKASSEIERQQWVTALELAKATAANHGLDTDDDDDVNELPRDEVTHTLHLLSSKLEDLRISHDMIGKHASALQKSLTELEALESANQDLSSKIKTVNERATLFRISSSTIINAHNEFVDLSMNIGNKWVRMLHHEREQRIRLEETIETLARQHEHLEEEAKEQMSHIPSPNQVQSEDEDDNAEFEDAIDELSEEIFLPVNAVMTSSNSDNSNLQLCENLDNISEGCSAEVDGVQSSVQVILHKERTPSIEKVGQALELSRDRISTDSVALVPNGNIKRKRRRSKIPDKPNYPINLWSILKNCIGKELSKIPMPVNFNEPLSFLQRLNEDFEYSDILNKAAQVEDSCEQLAWVAAFTISSYATTTVRAGKPFNPLLYETYECDRTDDMGWKSICEQVSHHPPIVAQHVKAKGWVSWQQFSMSSKFRGKYLQIIPLGIAHLIFNKSGNHYTWTKVSTTVHNLIVGKLWLDNHGEMEIINHKTKDKCCLKFIPYSYFSREIPKKVTGYIVDSYGTFKWFLTGTWDEKIEACRVTSSQLRNGKPVYETAAPKVLWRRNWVTPECERYYNFTEFACQLNEWEENVAPTDSRLRPDQRLMEEGRWDEANSEKLRLEEKQRATRRATEAIVEQAHKEGRDVAAVEPIWFTTEFDATTNQDTYKYKGGYWEAKQSKNWSMCPDIF